MRVPESDDIVSATEGTTHAMASKVASELTSLQISIARGEAEVASLSHNMELELIKLNQISQWMQGVADCANPERLLFEIASATTRSLDISDTFMEENDPNRLRWQDIADNLDDLLPTCFKTLEQSVFQYDIADVADVGIVLDSIRYANWCCLLLRLLRSPPSTPLLQKFVTKRSIFAATNSLIDDRIFKILGAILHRSR